jgi:hypothetical protein
MRGKSILALGAFLVLIIAIGCSNGGRTTTPGNTVESLNLPNNQDINRFEPVSNTPVVAANKISVNGTYYIDHAGCSKLQIFKGDLIELDMGHVSSKPLKSGTVVMVYGQIGTGPGTRCNLQKAFIVDELKVLRNPGQLAGGIPTN